MGFSLQNSASARQRARELERIPQRHIGIIEIAAYAVLPFLLIMAGAMPSAAYFPLMISLPLLYGLYRRFGIYFPFCTLCGYGVVALCINYDILTVIYFCTTGLAFCGLVLSVQHKNYLVVATIAAASAVVGALFGAGVVRLAEGVPTGDIAYNYVIAEKTDPVISFYSREYYSDMRSNEEKLDPSDEGYVDAAAKSYAEWAREEFGSLMLWYYCVHYGGIAGAVGFVLATVINRRTSCCYDEDATIEEVSLGSRSLGGVAFVNTPLSDMKIPRSYLWSVVLPTAVAVVILEAVGGYSPLSSAFVHAFITLPSAFGCFTVLAFFASLFSGKARIAADIILALIGLVAVALPFATFILGVVGLCDCIADLRFWTRFIRES